MKGGYSWIMWRAQVSNAPLGELGARELAIALLQHCWDGRLPEMYSARMAGLDQQIEGTV